MGRPPRIEPGCDLLMRDHTAGDDIRHAFGVGRCFGILDSLKDRRFQSH